MELLMRIVFVLAGFGIIFSSVALGVYGLWSLATITYTLAGGGAVGIGLAILASYIALGPLFFLLLFLFGAGLATLNLGVE